MSDLLEELNEKLSRAACESLERLAFLCPFPADGNEIPTGSGTETVQLHFSGPFSGDLLVILSSCALPELASNMLGIDPDEALPIEQQRDALREAVNIVCGNLMPKIAGVRAVFDLKAPELLEPGGHVGALAGREPDARVSLELDEGGIWLILLLEEGWKQSLATD